MTNEVGLASPVALHCQLRAVCLSACLTVSFHFLRLPSGSTNGILCVSRQTAHEFAFAFFRAWQKAKHSDKRLQTRQCDNASNKPSSAATLKLIN